MTKRTAATVEQVREAQENFKKGVTHHEAKEYKEAVEAFTRCSAVNPFNKDLIGDLNTKLKKGGFKLVQESMAHMGCAAEHLFKLVRELDEESRERVPVDDSLKKAFETW